MPLVYCCGKAGGGGFGASRLVKDQEKKRGSLKEAPLPPPPPPEEIFPDEEVSSTTFLAEPVPLQRGLTLLKGRVNSAEILGVSNTDLVAGKYEGGLKLWECTIDLIETLRQEIQDGRLSFRGKRVLELGCGHGLPGILACIKGATVVHFQDFNSAVLKFLTIPNVSANLERSLDKTPRPSDGHRSRLRELNLELRFFAGDWGDLHDLLSVLQPSHQSTPSEDGNSAEFNFSSSDGDVLLNKVTFAEDNGSVLTKALVVDNNSEFTRGGVKVRSRSRSGSRACDRATDASEGDGGYDIIVMSETVYTLSSLPKLYSLIKKCLRPPYGVVYVAAKKHYFGVGGGSRQFKSVVDEDGVMVAHLVAECADGSSNVREVWKYFFR